MKTSSPIDRARLWISVAYHSCDAVLLEDPLKDLSNDAKIYFLKLLSKISEKKPIVLVTPSMKDA